MLCVMEMWWILMFVSFFVFLFSKYGDCFIFFRVGVNWSVNFYRINENEKFFS